MLRCRSQRTGSRRHPRGTRYSRSEYPRSLPPSGPVGRGCSRRRRIAGTGRRPASTRTTDATLDRVPAEATPGRSRAPAKASSQRPPPPPAQPEPEQGDARDEHRPGEITGDPQVGGSLLPDLGDPLDQGVAGSHPDPSVHGGSALTGRDREEVIPRWAALFELDLLSGNRLDPGAIVELIVGATDFMPWRRSGAREIAPAALRPGVLPSALIGEQVGREAVQGVRALEAERHTLHVIGAQPVGRALHVAGEDCDVALL